MTSDSLQFLDRLAEFLGSSEGQTTEEIEAELIEEMGEEKYRAAMGRFLATVEEWKLKSKEAGPQ